MRRKVPLLATRNMSEISMTPLIDLSFLLLTTFIITFPLIEQGITVNLPTAKADKVTDERACTVTIDKAGNVYLDKIPVSWDDLKGRIHEMGKVMPDMSVLIRADESLRYSRVVGVMKIMRESGLRKIALVTQEE